MNMILRALMVSVWFMALTFPLVVLKVDALNDTILFRWENMASIGVGAFVLSIFWRWSIERKARGAVSTGPSLFARALEAVRQPKPRYTSMYQINIMISALIYIMLGLGLNIVVGLAGQLVLGYAAFYAVGAYTYGLLNTYFGLGFWAVLPVGGIMAALFGLMLGFPVLRLKGDYLAIVTLAFGEIIKNIFNILYVGVDAEGLHFSITNEAALHLGEGGISILQGPMGATANVKLSTFTVGTVLVLVSLFVVLNLVHSRAGRAIMAMRDNRIAAESVGISATKYKLMAFVTSAVLAGAAGALYAMHYSSVAAKKFAFNASILVLVFVVLGGLGNIRGSVIAAAFLTVLPEFLRNLGLDKYRMLVYAIVLILVMIATNNENSKEFFAGLRRKLVRSAPEKGVGDRG